MNWEALGTIADVAGAIAVVISLVYVARQVRATMEQSISDRLSENMMFASSSEMSSIIFRVLLDSSDISDEGYGRYIFYLSGWLRTLEQAHRQYRRGFLDKSIWAGYEAYLRMSMSANFSQAYWRDRRMIFNEEFRNLVDEIDTGTETISTKFVSEMKERNGFS
jgi:hypothetical protein